MNEQLQSKLVEILAAMQAGAKAAGDFALEQLPDIAQQYVAYGRLTATAYLLIWATVAVLLLWATCRWGYFHHKAVEKYGYWADHRVMVTVFGTIGAAVSFLVATAFIGDVFLVWAAPKVWLLKEIAHLIR